MATLTNVVDNVKAYYGVSDQEAPALPVIVMAAQSAIDAINDIRRYKPVCLIKEPEDEIITSLADDENTDETVPEQPDGTETPSVPSVPITPVIDVWDVLEDRYLSRAVRIAVYLCEKEGVDGVTSFSENGISRSFETGDIPASMLRTVTPICIGF